MTRLEIIANQAVEEDIIGIFAAHGYGNNFTYHAPVFGRGRHGRKEGSAIWPEENVVFILYLEDEDVEKLSGDIGMLKKKFKREGIRGYIQKGVEKLF